MPQYDALVSGIIMHQNYFTKNFLFVQQQILLQVYLIQYLSKKLTKTLDIRREETFSKLHFPHDFFTEGSFIFSSIPQHSNKSKYFPLSNFSLLNAKLQKKCNSNSKQNKIIRLAEDIRDRLQSKNQTSFFSIKYAFLRKQNVVLLLQRVVDLYPLI